eukprot:scaffold116_cov334-Pavlova_lutheri.AAC.9
MADEATAMDVEVPVPAGKNNHGKKKRFEIKKWNAVALWAWGACSYKRRKARGNRKKMSHQ